jgi:hypothetical protein
MPATDERLDNLAKRTDSGFDRVERRFTEFGDQIDRRFEQIDKRFDRIDSGIRALRVDTNNGFLALNQRFDRLHNVLLGGAGAIIAALVAPHIF